eukprot:g13511.t1
MRRTPTPAKRSCSSTPPLEEGAGFHHQVLVSSTQIVVSKRLSFDVPNLWVPEPGPQTLVAIDTRAGRKFPKDGDAGVAVAMVQVDRSGDAKGTSVRTQLTLESFRKYQSTDSVEVEGSGFVDGIQGRFAIDLGGMAWRTGPEVFPGFFIVLTAAVGEGHVPLGPTIEKEWKDGGHRVRVVNLTMTRLPLANASSRWTAVDNLGPVTVKGMNTGAGMKVFDAPVTVATVVPDPDVFLGDGQANYQTLSHVDAGFWRTSESSADVRPCPIPDLCAGGSGGGDDLCVGSNTGPYCQVCPSSQFSSVTGVCVECGSLHGVTAVQTLGLVLAAALLVAAATFVGSVSKQAPETGKEDHTLRKGSASLVHVDETQQATIEKLWNKLLDLKLLVTGLRRDLFDKSPQPMSVEVEGLLITTEMFASKLIRLLPRVPHSEPDTNVKEVCSQADLLCPVVDQLASALAGLGAVPGEEATVVAQINLAYLEEGHDEPEDEQATPLDVHEASVTSEQESLSFSPVVGGGDENNNNRHTVSESEDSTRDYDEGDSPSHEQTHVRGARPMGWSRRANKNTAGPQPLGSNASRRGTVAPTDGDLSEEGNRMSRAVSISAHRTEKQRSNEMEDEEE